MALRVNPEKILILMQAAGFLTLFVGVLVFILIYT